MAERQTQGTTRRLYLRSFDQPASHRGDPAQALSPYGDQPSSHTEAGITSALASTQHARRTAETAHQSAVVLAVGARGRGMVGGLLYTVCKAAGRHGASVKRQTADPQVAYAEIRAILPRSRFVKYRPGWLPDRD